MLCTERLKGDQRDIEGEGVPNYPLGGQSGVTPGLKGNCLRYRVKKLRKGSEEENLFPPRQKRKSIYSTANRKNTKEHFTLGRMRKKFTAGAGSSLSRDKTDHCWGKRNEGTSNGYLNFLRETRKPKKRGEGGRGTRKVYWWAVIILGISGEQRQTSMAPSRKT